MVPSKLSIAYNFILSNQFKILYSTLYKYIVVYNGAEVIILTLVMDIQHFILSQILVKLDENLVYVLQM